MSGNCVNATQLVNDLYRQKPDIALQSYVSHLWTDEKYLNEYKEKFAIKYSVTIDSNGEIARHYETTEYPTLLVFNSGKEIGRFTRFEKPNEVQADISKLLSRK
jgi:hypothetical protein